MREKVVKRMIEETIAMARPITTSFDVLTGSVKQIICNPEMKLPQVDKHKHIHNLTAKGNINLPTVTQL